MKARLNNGSLDIGEYDYPIDILIIILNDGREITIFSAPNQTYIPSSELLSKLLVEGSESEVDISDKLADEVEFSVDVKNGDLTVHAQKLLREFIVSVKK